MKKKLIAPISVLIMVLLLIVGCQPKDNRTFKEIEGFKPLKKSFINHKFDVKKDVDTFNVSGKYDLNGDGTKDEINLVLRHNFTDTTESPETYIEVNGIKQEIYMDYTEDGEVRLMDLDKNDDFIEIAFFDEGPSADPIYNIYRYDGKELYNLGNVDDMALTNEKGKLISSFYISDFEPAFYSHWFEVENNEFVLKSRDIEKYLGKEYVLKKTFAYFVPMDKIDEDYTPEWEKPQDFKTTKLTLLDIWYPYENDEVLNYYFIELADGRKGLMYFWIGD